MKRGFTVLEFLVVCVLLLAASTILLPRALEPRRAVNEEHALGYLTMIAVGERAWHQETGFTVPLHRLAEEPPGARQPEGNFSTRTPLLTPAFMVDLAGVGHRGGFRFQLARNLEGHFMGCWAWPNLSGFSGQDTYWADFSAGEIRRLREAPSWSSPPDTPPAAADLAPEILVSF